MMRRPLLPWSCPASLSTLIKIAEELIAIVAPRKTASVLLHPKSRPRPYPRAIITPISKRADEDDDDAETPYPLPPELQAQREENQD